MMTPTTFDVPNEIDDAVDELEPAGELGQVEDAEPGQDWNDQGVFIGAAEIIEVPFRRTVKSKATVRVVHDAEHDCWRAGWHWKTLLKLEGRGPAEVGVELNRERPPFEFRVGAVHDALDRMSLVAGKFDKRIEEDILKFRDTNCPDDPAAAEKYGDPNADDELLARHATEPRANAFDVLDADVAEVQIPLPKKLKAPASMRLAHDSQGWWRFGYHYEFNGLTSSGPPKLGGEKFPSRKQAQCAALRHAIGHYAALSADVADRIAIVLQTTEENATEEITGRDPEAATDPETQAAIDDLATVGVSVGEPAEKSKKAPPTEAELQAKAERAFKAKMREATDNLADCVLRRVDTEAAYKSAKAEEKAATETLRAIADRGPVRLPIMEYAERNAAAAQQQSTEPAKPAATVEPDAWKLASIDELNLPKGVTAKLVDDGIDTIGRLEQRRADISHKREKWPPGIGKAAIDKIENAVIEWLAKNQHADQATEVEPAAAEPTDAAPEVPTEAAAAAEATSDREIDPEIGDVAARLDELYGDPEFMCERTNGSYGSGREAYGRGDLLTDCPLVPGDEQDQWLMGWSDAREADEADAHEKKTASAAENSTDAADDLGDL